jgi:hypothetical protein
MERYMKMTAVNIRGTIEARYFNLTELRLERSLPLKGRARVGMGLILRGQINKKDLFAKNAKVFPRCEEMDDCAPVLPCTDVLP